jgi:hypothetical protein
VATDEVVLAWSDVPELLEGTLSVAEAHQQSTYISSITLFFILQTECEF